MGFFSWLRKLTDSTPERPDRPAHSTPPALPTEELRQVAKAIAALRTYPRRLEDTEEGRALLAQPDDEQRRMFRAAIAGIGDTRTHDAVYIAVLDVASQLAGRKLDWSHEDVVAMVTWITHGGHYWSTRAPILKAVHRYLAAHPMTPELHAAISALVASLQRGYTDASGRRVIHRLQTVLGGTTFSMPLQPGDAWVNAAIADVAALDPESQQVWHELLLSCSAAAGSTPTKKWRTAVTALVASIGAHEVRTRLLHWFPLVDQPRSPTTAPETPWASTHPLTMYTINVDVLRGLVWLCADHADRDIARALTALALSAQRKIPGEGPRLPRIITACAWALGEMAGPDGLAQLAILKVKVRSGSAQRVILSAMTTAAEREGLHPAEVEELLVPTYGLDKVGRRTETLGSVTAHLEVAGTTTVTLSWTKADGKKVASAPKAVKDEHGDELAELTAAVKDLKKMLPVQRDRIEQLYLERKTWPLELWQECYLHQPLVGSLARRLICASRDLTTVHRAHGTMVASLMRPISPWTGWHPRPPSSSGIHCMKPWRRCRPGAPGSPHMRSSSRLSRPTAKCTS